MFEVAVVCLVVTALLAYLNARFLQLPTTIGVMAIALLLSLALIGLDRLGFGQLKQYETAFLHTIDFSDLLMQGMLSLLLFAGALQVDLGQLKDYRWQVGLLAVLGTLASALVIGIGLWWLLPLFGLSMSLAYCLVFGALISPTDPVAVLGVLKSAKVSSETSVVVAGESLFNDGVGVVLFALFVGIAVQASEPTAGESVKLLLHEAGGGLVLGGVLGWILFMLLKSIDNYSVEVLLTLAAVLGGYQLANQLHVSGPLAMVVAGLITGNHGRAEAMSDTTRHHVDLFWELLDEILNAVLFVLLGLEIVMVPMSRSVLLMSVAVIALTLGARWLTVGLPVAGWHKWFRLPRRAWRILTWGGLRGGISVALALSLPAGPSRDLILALTYASVVFSILVQGLSMQRVAQSMAQEG